MIISANNSITFGPLSGSGPRSSFTDVTLSAPVTQAVAILTGFNVSYAPADGDHHLGDLDVRLSTGPPAGATVRVTATYGLRDWSGNWDDRYQGEIFFTVVAE
jgi:hypothetical protein